MSHFGKKGGRVFIEKTEIHWARTKVKIKNA